MNAKADTNERTREQTTEQANGKREQREPRDLEWVPQVLALIVVTPALFHAVLSLQNLPIV